MADLILIIMVIAAIVLSFAIGTNDETFAPVVGVKRLSVKTAVILGAVVAVVGSFVLAPNVSDTLNNDVSTLQISAEPLLIFALFASMAVCLILASVFGLPISSTEAMIGSIIGLTLISYEKIIWSWGGMGHIFFTWIFSPILGFVSSLFLMKLTHKILSKRIKGFRNLETSNAISGSFLLIMVVVAGFFHEQEMISAMLSHQFTLCFKNRARQFSIKDFLC